MVYQIASDLKLVRMAMSDIQVPDLEWRLRCAENRLYLWAYHDNPGGATAKFIVWDYMLRKYCTWTSTEDHPFFLSPQVG